MNTKPSKPKEKDNTDAFAEKQIEFVSENFMSTKMLSSIVLFIGIFIIMAGIYMVVTQPQRTKIVGFVVVGIGIFDIVGALLFAKYLRPDNQQ